MYGEVPFKAIEYGTGDSEEVVALVGGLARKNMDMEHSQSELERAGVQLASRGIDAVLYEYHPRVLMAGEPALLPALVDTLHNDFLLRAKGYEKRRYVGVSLGGAIAANMQKKFDAPEHGLFAATGADAARLVMKNRLFRVMTRLVFHADIRREYERNGHDMQSLREAWDEFQQPPVTPFTLAIGTLDYIVREREVLRNVTAWRAKNPDVQLIRQPGLSHNGTIKWFSENIVSLRERA